MVSAILIAFTSVGRGLPSAHGAELETHLFSATLSLTGGCSESPTDPVHDPGLCPMPPGVPGVDHPELPFDNPTGEAVDSYGDIYVASHGPSLEEGVAARVDIFNSAGRFLLTIKDPGAKQIAVDSEGHLYVYNNQQTSTSLQRYDPTKYNPEADEIDYGLPPVTVLEESSLFFTRNGIAIDTSNNHLYVNIHSHINEYSSAAEGNELIDATIGAGVLHESVWLAVNGENHDVYASDREGAEPTSEIVIFKGEAGHPEKGRIKPTTSPDCEFSSKEGLLSVVIEEATGHVFVDDRRSTSPTKKPVYEYEEIGEGEFECIAKIEHKFEYVLTSNIAVDNGPHSPNNGTLYVPSSTTAPGHLFAFIRKPETGPPVVESTSVADVSQSDAQLQATIDPHGLETSYRLEYTTQQRFEEEGFIGALLAGEGVLTPAIEGVPVSAAATDLLPGTAYRFRALAENACELSECSDEAETAFTTFAEAGPQGSCPNEMFRTGATAMLPDCRAYELVTPPDTGGHKPYAIGNNSGSRFGTPTATANGKGVSFLILGGALPGFSGTGGFNGDVYVSTREESSWVTASAGPTGAQTTNPLPGGLSPDLAFAVTTATEGGTLPIEGKETRYVRHPDGSFVPLGLGSLGVAPEAEALYISPGGTNIIFRATTRLEPFAPPEGTEAIYDRRGEETQVLSLLPGEDGTPGAGENARFKGVSGDGSVVAFTIGSSLYVRVDEEETIEVANGGSTFAGVSQDGSRIFYLKGGDLFAFDLQGEVVTPFSSSGDVTVVNVSPDGSHAYFVSPSVINPGEENPNHEQASEGDENLYLADGTATHFVASLTERDVEGETPSGGGPHIDGLGLWTAALPEGTAALDPSRTDTEGNAIVFESRASLTAYDSGGKAEVYRYDVLANRLSCLSCDPTQGPAGEDAHLLAIGAIQTDVEPTSRFSIVPNLSSDGQRAFFETPAALVATDTNGVGDVYEWEEQGTGSCTTPGGCVSLISSGHSSRPSYLYGVSASGDDVFFTTSDLLVPADTDETPSIYDAAVDGGIAEPHAHVCQGEGCRGQLSPPPILPAPASPSSDTSGNVAPRRKCANGRHKIKRHGKTRCVLSHSKKHSHRRGAHR
jgi:hypothetical protein